MGDLAIQDIFPTILRVSSRALLAPNIARVVHLAELVRGTWVSRIQIQFETVVTLRIGGYY